MRSRLWSILWMLGILFPMALAGRLWPAWGRFFEAVFAPAWMHIVMHALLYAGLGLLLTRWVQPDSPCRVTALLGIILLTGCAQEAIQIVGAGAWPGWKAELLDLCVDLAGACPGLLAAHLVNRRLLPRKGRPTAPHRGNLI